MCFSSFHKQTFGFQYLGDLAGDAGHDSRAAGLAGQAMGWPCRPGNGLTLPAKQWAWPASQAQHPQQLPGTSNFLDFFFSFLKYSNMFFKLSQTIIGFSILGPPRWGRWVCLAGWAWLSRHGHAQPRRFCMASKLAREAQPRCEWQPSLELPGVAWAC